MKNNYNSQPDVEGKFVDLKGERYYKISHVDQMQPFFISVVSSSDHWLFISSTGCLSAGRIRPENALFPYKSVDYIHENAENTGSKSIFRINDGANVSVWEPFNAHQTSLYDIERHLYKNSIGDKLVFEEINHTLQLKYQYSWNTSEQFGFVRHSELTDFSGAARHIELLDGLQNLLPSGAPLGAMQKASALVDAYKWNEQLTDSSLSLFSMYAKLSDKAEPAESLLTTTVFSIDTEASPADNILLTSKQLNRFRQGGEIQNEPLTKGVRGSYLLHKSIELQANQTKSWTIVADIDKSHTDVCELQQLLAEPKKLAIQLAQSVASNQQELVKLMSGADAWQLTAEENTSVHHYANVLFNNMRGGVFVNGYQLEKADVVNTLTNANQRVMSKHSDFVDALSDDFSHAELVSQAKQTGDEQLVRLSYEYLPLTFGRRHGDPSRPWNHYEIKLKDEQGERLLSYQGNWRDIFQNWEASALSYPGFIKSFIAKFVNASTVDGYNPYRITKDGVDWERPEADDPWSNIGYWGDHQIIYLLKFLELADKFEQKDLIELLDSDIFSYANVPYVLCGVDKLFKNPKDTVEFDENIQQLTEQRVDALGSDGRLIMTQNGDDVYMVNLMEKVLVPLLAKLSNLVLDGGIWLNTQRPEWNDANNAIVGNGLSMVTLYYMRRYVAFMQKILSKAPISFSISNEVGDWMLTISSVLSDAAQKINQGGVTPEVSKALLTSLAESAAKYREEVYAINGFSGKKQINSSEIATLLAVSLEVLDSSIKHNLREDGLYNAYNILDCSENSLAVEELYPMLEGQVAVLSAGLLTPVQAVDLLDKLFASEMYREDQSSFMLYPDRDLKTFMNKNKVSAAQVKQNKLLSLMVDANDRRIVLQDSKGDYHFNANFENSSYLQAALNTAKGDYSASEDDGSDVEKLYEQVFNHKAFTGRSGTMFGYEGLGSIYWHMISKLLLAVQENYQASLALDEKAGTTSKATAQLADYYYQVRAGIGFNKTPQNYGAFPTDPYSHTPKHSGAQQPGMTGQVKEEVLTRFGELGLEVRDGAITINPSLLKYSEFLTEPVDFNYQPLAGEAKSITVEIDQLAFTYCQVAFIYQVNEQGTQSIALHFADGKVQILDSLNIVASFSAELFTRSGKIDKIVVNIARTMLR